MLKYGETKQCTKPPIFQTSTFVFDDIEHVEKVMSFNLMIMCILEAIILH